MNEQDLDSLIAAHGNGYNRPPANPPLLEIRNRVYAERRRRSRRFLAASSMAAAAAVVLAVGIITREAGESGRFTRSSESVRSAASSHPAARMAELAAASALRSAEVALQKNPDDPYYAEHLANMKSNAEYFRQLQQRQAGS